MRVRFYQVECGDAASITFEGEDGNVHYIFIDAGYERTYRQVLKSEVESIVALGGKIDLWVISHIHDDHIGGIISYIKAIEKGEAKDIVTNWWFNHPNKTVASTPAGNYIDDISAAKSFAQGEKLTKYLTTTGNLPSLDIVKHRIPTEVFGLKIIVISPTPSGLEQLREKYKDASLRTLDYHELTAISEPKGAVSDDYNKKVEEFDSNLFTEDTSIENDSSIATLIEWNGKKILWLADALPSTIADTLKSFGYSENLPLEVDLVKVSHHGSRGNNSNELYDLIRCDRYVFCASGDNKNRLPTKECMVRILKNRHRPGKSNYEFLFPYDNIALRSIFEVDGCDIYKNLRFKMTFCASKWLEVCL